MRGVVLILSGVLAEARTLALSKLIKHAPRVAVVCSLASLCTKGGLEASCV